MGGFRTYIRGVSRWRLVAWLIGIALIYLGGGWPLNGPGVIGAILVVASIFRWPWGHGAYRLRCARKVSDAAQAIEVATRRLQEQQKRDMGRFLRLPLPDTLKRDGDALIRLIEETSAVREKRDAPLPERSVTLVHLRVRSERISAQIAAAARTADERNYSDAIGSLMESNAEAADKQERSNLQIVTNVIAYLDRLRPPGHFKAGHDLLRQAFRDELVALSHYYETLHGSEADEVRTAASTYQEAAQTSYARLEDLGIRTAGGLPRRAR